MVEEVAGWGQSVAVGSVASPLRAVSGIGLATAMPEGSAYAAHWRGATWHGFTAAGLGAARPTALCGASFDAIGPLRPQGSIPGEVCHACRAAAGV